jgi:hypothetical protein
MSIVQDLITKRYDNSYAKELGYGGSFGLRDIVGKYFLPELQNAQRSRSQIQDAFLGQVLNPGSLYDAASTAAKGYAETLFAPGGEVAGLISKARGDAISRGFNPSAGNKSELGVLNQATQQVGNFFAQQAGGLEQSRFSALAGANQFSNQSVNDLLQSIFTGVASSEQLNLAQSASKPKFLGLF